MKHLSKTHLIVVWLFSTLVLGVQSCDDKNVSLEKSKVQFSLNAPTSSEGRLRDIDLPDDARLRLSIKRSSGTPVFSDHEIGVLKAGNGYMTDLLELMPGTYVITDFMIVNDSEVLNAVPKSQSPLSSNVTHSLPFNFTVTENGIANVTMEVIDARNEKPEAFGYASFKVNKANKLSFMVSTERAGRPSLKEATAELRRGKDLIKTFSVKSGINTIDFIGEPDAVYTLSVYAGNSAQVKTFNFRELKNELGSKPLKMTLEPALLLTIESFVEEGNPYDEYFELFLDGTGGTVNVNWGNGYEESHALQFYRQHVYTIGSYTAIVTGDLDQITNLYGFSYGTVILGIKGLTNLPALKSYSPSWGAVPIKVDLSNCKELETIFIEKLGGPYETIDLRTEFKLPAEHFIREFVFYAPSLDPTRENITAEELKILVDNIYNNTTQRDIYDGKFFVYPIDTPSPETQQKLDILQNEYNWDVRLDGNIWDFDGGRTKQDVNARRENWLRQKFPNSKHLSRSAKVALAD
jgi:hypothetical protein